MSQLSKDELISAYLDGEVSAAEKAEVERWLAADPAARTLLGEFRAVRAAVGALPRFQVGEDLSQMVLRAAERQMLSETPLPASGGWRGIARRALRPRNLLWPLLAAAASLMIYFWHGDPAAWQVAKEEPRAAEPAPADHEGLTVVRVEVPAAAVRQRAFERILEAEFVQPKQMSNDPNSALARIVDGSRDEMPVSSAAKPVYVEVQMTPEQLRNVLEQLKADPQTFRDLKEERRAADAASQAGNKRHVVFVLQVAQ